MPLERSRELNGAEPVLDFLHDLAAAAGDAMSETWRQIAQQILRIRHPS
ncbi:MAG: hypothetical protein AAB150_19795 [Pseudomonadota bacterium]